jgi:hypothetical protein
MFLPALLIALAAPAPSDTIRIEVGSDRVDGRVYRNHRARVRVYRNTTDGKPITQWTNELVVGDSAGRKVMRWTTLGQFDSVTGKPGYELLQTYDHRTLAPYGYLLTSKSGARIQLAIDGNRLRGTRRLPNDSTTRTVDETVPKMGFVAGASDIVPAAVGFAEGRVIVAPFWAPNMKTAEMRIFSIIRKEKIRVEGQELVAWRVEERRESDKSLLATYHLMDESPYMVAGEVPLPDGQVNKMTEVAEP